MNVQEKVKEFKDGYRKAWKAMRNDSPDEDKLNRIAMEAIMEIEEQRAKVYCLQCEHHVRETTKHEKMNDWCNAYMSWEDTPLQRIYVRGTCAFLNRRNDCKKFERKEEIVAVDPKASNNNVLQRN